MASILYRQGNTHTVDGVKCEVVRCEAWEVPLLLGSGCVADVAELAESASDELPADKDELEAIAREYGVELDKRKSVKSLQEQVRSLIDGNQG